jgi:hypothetical protein
VLAAMIRLRRRQLSRSSRWTTRRRRVVNTAMSIPRLPIYLEFQDVDSIIARAITIQPMVDSMFGCALLYACYQCNGIVFAALG